MNEENNLNLELSEALSVTVFDKEGKEILKMDGPFLPFEEDGQVKSIDELLSKYQEKVRKSK